VVKSVGFGIYKLKSNIKTPTDNEIVKKKSSIPLGSGTIIIKSIANTNATTPKSVISLNIFSEFLILFTRFHPYNII
jgi:hypothetical protein